MTAITHPHIKARVLDGWFDGLSGATTEVPDDAPTDWATAFASHDMRGTQPARDPAEPIGQIAAWYQANTGHNPALSYISPTSGTATWTINDAWLAANNGNGRVSFADGRWLVERYELAGMIRVAASNVTLRNIHQNSGGALYGLQSRAVDGSAPGLIMEHSTLNGNYIDGSASAAINFPAATDPNQITLRNVEIFGYRAGIYCFAGITAEYCWVHDLFFSEGSHNTPASIRNGNVWLRRNLLADGNSSAMSFYPEFGPYTNIMVEENVFRLTQSDTGFEVIFAEGRATSELLPGQSRILRNNIFYKGSQYANPGGGFTASCVTGLSEIYGNIDRDGDPVVAP